MKEYKKAKVMKALDPYQNVIHECISEGVQQTFELACKVGCLTKRTRASFCYDLTVDLLKKKLADNFIIIEEYASYFFIVKNENVVFRFKKFDENGNSKNIGTQRVFDFNNGQLELPNIEKPITVEIGYLLNSFGNEISSVSVQSRSEIWGYEIVPTYETKVVTADFNSQDSEQNKKRVFLKGSKEAVIKAQNDDN